MLGFCFSLRGFSCFLYLFIAAPLLAAESIDLSAWDGRTPFELRGPWDFYWQKHLGPEEIDQHPVDAQIPAGRHWNGLQLTDQHVLGPFGYATYRLSLKQLSSHKTGYILRIPNISTSYRLWIYQNQQLLGYQEAGVVGTDSQTTVPSLKARFLSFNPTESGDITLLVHVANFTPYYGGMGFIPRLSPGDASFQQAILDAVPGIFSLGICFGLATYLFMLWLRHKSLRSSLWLALGTVFVSTFSLPTQTTLASLFPDSAYVILRKLEYLSMAVAPACLIQFFHHSYGIPAAAIYHKKSYYRFLNAWNLLTLIPITGALFLPVSTMTQNLSLYQSYVGLALVYGLFFLYLGVRQNAASVLYSIGGIIVISITVGYDIGQANAIFETTINTTPLGVALLLIFQAQAVAQQNAETYRESRRLARELREQDKARTLLFHNTSHELRTPLNGILGFLELAIKGAYGELSPIAHKQISKAYHLAEGLKAQVNTILDLAKFKRGDLRIVTQTIRLDRLKADVDRLAEGLILNNPKVSYTSSLEAEELSYRGDQEKIFTLLRNLIGNAIKFCDNTRPNHVALSIHHKPGTLVLSIKDTGIGIAPEFQKTIFDEFSQVQTDARRSYEGTGLGLTMVRDLVHLLGGTLSLTSELGRGSTFTITLPERAESELIIAASEPDKTDPYKIDIHEGSEVIAQHQVSPAKHDAPGKGWSITIIDDNPINCEVIEGILAQDGYHLESFQRGSQGIEAMRLKQPDVLLLDMMMPEMSGEDVINAMRADGLLQEIPVILITARASEEDRLEGLKLGADDYLAKPIFAPELRLRVRNMIMRHRVLRQAERSTQDDKLLQLGELFGELSHELKNILHGSTMVKGLKLEDALLSTSVLSLEDNLRQNFAKSLIAPDFPGDTHERLDSLKENLANATESLERILRYSLVELALDVKDLQLLWDQLKTYAPEELSFTASQLKLFLEYKQLQQTIQRSNQLTQSVLSYTRESTADSYCRISEVWHLCLPLLSGRFRKLQIQWSANLPPLSVKIGSSALMQILLNLVSNAIDAVQHLSPELRQINLYIEEPGEKHIKLCVSNAGLPIPGPSRSKLFQRGFTTKGNQGSGIGLYVSRKLAISVGGDLFYDEESSQPTFILTLTRD